MQYQFLLDTTGQYSFIYIIKNERTIVYAERYLNEKNLSYSLTTYLEDCFKMLKIGYSDFNKLFLVYGPGKFSAMRIASVLIKTWASIFAIPIYIIDKFVYIADEPSCSCIVESDGNKHFVVQFKNDIQVSEPLLLDNQQLKEFISANENSNFFYDTKDKISEIGYRLKKFKKASDDFELIYLKPPC